MSDTTDTETETELAPGDDRWVGTGAEIEPTQTTPVLRRRQAVMVERPPAAQGPADRLIEQAKLVAAAGSDVLPKGFRSNPGACLMAIEWAERMGVSIFEAVGEISFVYGKPVVSAVMQKRLASRVGYTTEVIESTESLCTVAVHGPDGAERGRYTYTIGLAADLGLVDQNELYHKDPRQMLYKRATTRALEHYGPPDLATVFQEGPPPGDELVQYLPPVPDDDAGDQAKAEPEPEPAPVTKLDDARAKLDTEPDDDGEPAAVDLNDVLKVARELGIKPAQLREQSMALGHPIKAVADLASNQPALIKLAEWLLEQPAPGADA